LVIAIACLNMKLTIEEAIVAATFNAACAIDKQQVLGSIEPGKQADCIIIRGDNYRILPYHIGMNNVSGVVKKGNYLRIPSLVTIN
ncbi:amidohydrolase family protein, partial [bacterium]|nr:amidohydrolase family protein [bacterium]